MHAVLWTAGDAAAAAAVVVVVVVVAAATAESATRSDWNIVAAARGREKAALEQVLCTDQFTLSVLRTSETAAFIS